MNNVNCCNGETKIGIKKQLEEAKMEVEELGGWKSFKDGEWFFKLVQKSFKNYYERASYEYFKTKYSSTDEELIVKKLVDVAAKNAGLLGAVVGATVSTDEIVAFFTGGEGGVGLPANIAIAATAISSESILLVRIQMQLIANIAKVYRVPLDPNDPEDIITIIAFALGGSASELAGNFGMKVGSRLAAKSVKNVIKKDVLAAIKKIGAKIGVKVLQKTIVKYTVPVASIGIGSSWNYMSTKAIAKIAKKHFRKRCNELL